MINDLYDKCMLQFTAGKKGSADGISLGDQIFEMLRLSSSEMLKNRNSGAGHVLYNAILSFMGSTHYKY